MNQGTAASTIFHVFDRDELVVIALHAARPLIPSEGPPEHPAPLAAVGDRLKLGAGVAGGDVSNLWLQHHMVALINEVLGFPILFLRRVQTTG